MKSELYDIERFFGYARPTATDFKKEEFLCRLIESAQAILTELRRDPINNKEAIVQEKITIKLARQELLQLKNRIDFF